MASPLIRILSDLHYGDIASPLTSLPSLAPLFEGADQIILNGDSLDTRPSKRPQRTQALRHELNSFFASAAPPVTFVTGNHDPDISSTHACDLADGNVFVLHGDAIFDDLVPWSQDAPLARRLLAAELAAIPPEQRSELQSILGACRRAAAAIPQRHQSEPHGLKYLLAFAKDTVWPPLRVFRVLRAWRDAPQRAAAFATRHRPQARFVVMGHTHRFGISRTRSGVTILNTGSICPPRRAGVVDVTDDHIVLRSIERHSGKFRLGAPLASFSLAQHSQPQKLPA